MEIAEVKPKADLTSEQKESKHFQVVKYVADSLYAAKKCHITSYLEAINKNLGEAGLHDEKVILECLEERVNKHNGIITATKKKIHSLRYERWWHSALFKGINLDLGKCKRLVDENQHWEVYDIYKLYFNSEYKPRA